MRRWLIRIVAAGCVWGAALGFAVFTERDPHPVVLAAAVAAALTVVWLWVDAYQSPDDSQWSLYRAAAPARSFDPRFSRLSQELDEASDPQSASLAVHTSLSDIADRILLERYQVDRVEHPEVAREILGEQVWSYLGGTAPTGKAVFSPQLFAVLDRLESL